MAPHVLDVGCDEYKVLAGEGGSAGRRLRQAADDHQPAPAAGDRAGAAAAARVGAAAGHRLRRRAAQRSVSGSDAGEVHVRARSPRRHARRLPRGRPLRARDGRHHAGAEGGAVVPRLATRGRGRERRRHRSATRVRRSSFSGADARSRLPRVDATHNVLARPALLARARVRRRRRRRRTPPTAGPGARLARRHRHRAEPVGRRGEQDLVFTTPSANSLKLSLGARETAGRSTRRSRAIAGAAGRADSHASTRPATAARTRTTSTARRFTRRWRAQLDAINQAVAGAELTSVHSVVGQGDSSITVIQKNGTGNAYAASLFEATALTRLVAAAGARYEAAPCADPRREGRGAAELRGRHRPAGSPTTNRI